MKTLVVLALFVGFLRNGFVVNSKECTNSPTQLSSHGLRYEILKSKNESWRAEMFSHYHLTPTDDSAWTSLLPRKLLSQENRDEDELEWSMMYRKMKKSGGIVDDVGPENFLREVSLHDVRLASDSIHGRAQQTNLEYLLLLDSDSLVWSFRKTAGLSTPGKPYGGWEDPNIELRGHFVGHYLGASAQMWASTHNETLRAKMSEIVSALSACQDKIGTGYLSAFPSELFDRFEAIKPVWAPYYTIHKVLAGLLEQYTLAGNEKALKMMTWMVDYFYKRVQSVILKHTVERHYLSLNEETGGMNDVLYKLYRITADPKHLLLAHLFDKPCFLGLLAVQADELSGFHSNTHIPIVIGAQLRYEVTGDQLYREIGKFFMETVNSSHSYATGGTSVSEFWADPKRMANHLQTENEESCTTYNMLKVSRHLFRWTKEASYADYYERALTNGVLGIQRGTEPGVMIYMLPMGRGASKAKSYHGWGTKFDSFWCCYGTGIESFSKLGNSIYFEERSETPGLYIIQYISSSLAWKLGGLALSQRVEPVNSWDQNLRVSLRVSSVTEKRLSALNLRVPSWTRSIGAGAKLNGKDLSLPPPGNFLSITRNWSPDDELTLNFPMSLRTEPIKDDRPEYGSIKAILYGPYLLAGHTNGDWDIKSGSSDWITPVPSKHNNLLFTLSQSQGDSIFAASNTNETLTMQKIPQPGTDSSLRATFRLVIMTNSSEPSLFVEDIIGKPVAFEPMDFPGTAVGHRGQGNDLVVVVSDHSSSSSSLTVFLISRGLDQRNDTVSLESQSKRGCFVYSTSTDNGALKLSCDIGSSSEDSVKKAASFVMHRGLSKYHPLSFVAKGSFRNFLLAPLFSFMDESYTVYFNIGT